MYKECPQIEWASNSQARSHCVAPISNKVEDMMEQQARRQIRKECMKQVKVIFKDLLLKSTQARENLSCKAHLDCK